MRSGPKGIGFGGVLADSGLKGDGEEVDYAQSDEGRASQAATKHRSFVPKRLSNRFGAASRPSPRGFSSGPAANECNKCGKTVGFAERLTALDAVWHKDCFRCNECNKRLNKGEFADSDGVAYCNP
ncbi:LIM and SH3 domain protein 1 [Hondaea fermentalgiana]|uniref:LIM and SH3 domain protein 1 n=1 Tax=Hondaea fermentalgiana TaxID=2315210 RepID=A0A2R5GFP3_9STRA|nr:LIM and SH3 domain protein 1 [Hondaea fermentalgiana]|eukprot:GBG29732.1 LIM and SH3 domain protein 1 [Hondaea fermentalgiana]